MTIQRRTRRKGDGAVVEPEQLATATTEPGADPAPAPPAPAETA